MSRRTNLLAGMFFLYLLYLCTVHASGQAAAYLLEPFSRLVELYCAALFLRSDAGRLSVHFAF